MLYNGVIMYQCAPSFFGGKEEFISIFYPSNGTPWTTGQLNNYYSDIKDKFGLSDWSSQSLEAVPHNAGCTYKFKFLEF